MTDNLPPPVQCLGAALLAVAVLHAFSTEFLESPAAIAAAIAVAIALGAALRPTAVATACFWLL